MLGARVVRVTGDGLCATEARLFLIWCKLPQSNIVHVLVCFFTSKFGYPEAGCCVSIVSEFVARVDRSKHLLTDR